MRHDLRNKPLFRLLFALKPTVVIARQTDHFAQMIAADAPRILPEHQHVTLAVTSDQVDYPYRAVKSLLRAGTRVMAEPFDLPLDRLSSTNRSVALRPSRSVPLLNALQHAIVAGMQAEGVAIRPDWTFSPHQTLFYRRGSPEQRRIDGFTWRVEDFVLLCSHVGHAHHEILGTWPLKGDGQYSLF